MYFISSQLIKSLNGEGKYFVKNYKKWNITSVAFPQLGTSHGKLDWNDVRPLMENYLNSLDINVEIFIKSYDKIKNYR